MSGISSGIARRDDGSSRKSDDGSLDDDGSVRAVPLCEKALKPNAIQSDPKKSHMILANPR
jgi:hypothetical protein